MKLIVLSLTAAAAVTVAGPARPAANAALTNDICMNGFSPFALLLHGANENGGVLARNGRSGHRGGQSLRQIR